jgi:integrase
MKSALNNVFRLLLRDSGMERSPFDTLPSRRISSLSQRPFTREEYRRILAVAPSPWKEAVQIAWYTGLREKDVFTLKWSEISGDLIRKLPAKTARFRREVLIPIHPALQRVLDALPRNGERVLGAWAYKPNYIYFKRSFGKILADAGIEQESASGRVVFNSLRNSFISRCDAAGIPRHAIRGIVGHVSDSMTDLYSHDETSARLIQTLPG